MASGAFFGALRQKKLKFYGGFTEKIRVVILSRRIKMALQSAFSKPTPVFSGSALANIGPAALILDTGHHTLYNVVNGHLRGREFDQTTELGFRFPYGN
jgi:hypothetical protein